MYAEQKSSKKSFNIWLMYFWKVLEVLANPKEMTSHSNSL